LKPARDPNIQKLALMDDSVLVFNYELGWYDVVTSAVEGIDVVGHHDTISLASVQRLELAATPDAVETTLLILAIIVIGVVVSQNMFNTLTPIP
jgi:hypothetical protein